MTEAEWLACADPTLMVEFVRGKVSHRKLRLFEVGCCRRLLPVLEEPVWGKCLDAAERYLDGRLSAESLRGWNRKLSVTTWQAPMSWRRFWEATRRAFDAATSPVGGNQPHAVHFSVGLALARAAENRDGGDWESTMRTEAAASSDLIRCVCGNPFRPVAPDPTWLTSTVLALAANVYERREFSLLPILADALQDAGCEHDEILAHRRSGAPHARGCWVIDLLLGQEQSLPSRPGDPEGRHSGERRGEAEANS